MAAAYIGINSFERTAGLGNVSITGSGGSGGNQFINANLTTTLQNPSNISLQTNDLSLVVFYEDVKIGRAAINVCSFASKKNQRGFNSDLQVFYLVPGENTILAEFHYEPDNANDTIAQSFLGKFIQTGDKLPLTISGDSSSSPYPSLIQALEGVSLSASLNGTSDFPLSIPQPSELFIIKALTPHQLSHISTSIFHYRPSLTTLWLSILMLVPLNVTVRCHRLI
jgi:hypothetical protein